MEKNYKMGTFLIFALNKWLISECRMGETCGTHEGTEKYSQNFNQKTLR